jgi:hypothetical protein
MNMWIRKRRSLVISTIILGCVLVLTTAACSPKESSTTDTAPEVPTSNDTVVIGELNRYEPQEATDAKTGPSLGIDEETELQQEKTTGGAGGAVTSTNIQPMEPGSTAYSDDPNPPGFVGMTGEPPAVSHGTTNGTECLSCHESGTGDSVPVSESHKANKVTDDLCASCHTGLN